MRRKEFQTNLLKGKEEIIRLPFLKYSTDKIRDRNTESYQNFDRKRYKINIKNKSGVG